MQTFKYSAKYRLLFQSFYLKILFLPYGLSFVNRTFLAKFQFFMYAYPSTHPPVIKKVTFTLCFFKVSRIRPVSSFPQGNALLMDYARFVLTLIRLKIISMGHLPVPAVQASVQCTPQLRNRIFSLTYILYFKSAVFL